MFKVDSGVSGALDRGEGSLGKRDLLAYKPIPGQRCQWWELLGKGVPSVPPPLPTHYFGPRCRYRKAWCRSFAYGSGNPELHSSRSEQLRLNDNVNVSLQRCQSVAGLGPVEHARDRRMLHNSPVCSRPTRPGLEWSYRIMLEIKQTSQASLSNCP